ncbi:MAG: type II secretion system protein GspN [Desulfobacterales bacterium]|nr:type II secretion system protein GspN [Desulfobacterales bacterium]
MKRFISKNKKRFGYLLFALVLTAALLYYRFPSDVLRDHLQAAADKAAPSLLLSVDRIEPSIPIGLNFLKTKIAFKDIPDRVIFTADSFLLRPQLMELLRGKSKYSFHGIAYKGDLNGCVYIKKDGTNGFIDTEIELKNIHIGDYTYLAYLIGRHIEGTLGGTISYKGRHDSLTTGSGKANLTLSHGRIKLLRPLLTFDSIDFNEMGIEMVLKKQKIKIARLKFKGRQLQGTLSGTITLKEEFTKSILDLRGTVEPFAALFKNATGIQDTVKIFKERLNMGTLSFVIRGTLKEPKVKFT